MTWTAALDYWLGEPAPDDALAAAEAPSRLQAILMLLSGVLSWTLAEVLMAPVLKPMTALLLIAYAGAVAGLLGWYYRINRLFDSPWHDVRDALPAYAGALLPLHLLLPVSLACRGGESAGPLLVYELVKLSVVLMVLTRLSRMIEGLTGWPKWGGVFVAWSPIAVTVFAMLVFALMGFLGLLIVAAGALPRL